MANYDLIYPGQTIDQLLTTAYYLKNAGYIFLGSASSFSGTPSQRAWLIAPSGFTGFGFSEPIPIGSMGICLYNGASWSGVTINVVTVDETMSAGSDNPISSGAVYDVLSTITQGISAQLDSLELADTTDPSDILDVLTVALKMTKGGFNVVVSSLNILSATASKAGLMSAADKIKLDGFVNNIRSLVFADTTPSSDLGTKIVESLKWTVDNVQEVITTLTLLAASTEKAGLMSAADKAYVDGLPTTLGTLTSALQDMMASILSIVFDDTTSSSDKANKIVETMKWTSGGIQRAITTLTILSATASKAGLMSATDKAYVDGLPATLTSLSNSINSIETDLLNYYTKEQTYSRTEVDTLLDGKQNVIGDLTSIRSGAAAGATAVQPAAMNSAISSVRASIGYYECSTAAGTAAKTVSASGYTLTNGGCIRIKMTNANTADNATLNINGTGAKALFYDGAQASSANTWEAGEVLEVYYDGTQYQCVSSGGGRANRVKYDNSGSGLSSDNVQGAIDEVIAEVTENKNYCQSGVKTKFVQGIVSSSDGNIVAASDDITSVFIEGGCIVTAKNGYCVRRVAKYNKTTEAYIGEYAADDYTRMFIYLEDGYKYRFTVYAGGTNISPNDDVLEYVKTYSFPYIDSVNNPNDFESIIISTSGSLIQSDENKTFIYKILFEGQLFVARYYLDGNLANRGIWVADDKNGTNIIRKSTSATIGYHSDKYSATKSDVGKYIFICGKHGTSSNYILNVGYVSNGVDTALDGITEEVNNLVNNLYDELEIAENVTISDYIYSGWTTGADLKWATGTNCIIIPVKHAKSVTITANSSYNAQYVFLKTCCPINNTLMDVSNGSSLTIVYAGTTVEITIPNDAAFMFMFTTLNNTDRKPSSVVLHKAMKETFLMEQPAILNGIVSEGEWIKNHAYLSLTNKMFAVNSYTYCKYIHVNEGDNYTIIADRGHDCEWATLKSIPDLITHLLLSNSVRCGTIPQGKKIDITINSGETILLLNLNTSQNTYDATVRHSSNHWESGNIPVVCVPVYGQSLAVGGDAPRITNSAKFPLITFNSELLINSFSDTQETAKFGLLDSYVESLCIDRCVGQGNVGSSIMSFSFGQGSRSIIYLKKGTTLYTQFLAKIQSAYDIVGNSLVVPAFCWIQGEDDRFGTYTDDYKGELLQLRTDLDADIKAITGQTQDVHCIVYQTNQLSIGDVTPGHFVPDSYNSGDYGGLMTVPTAQYELIRDNPYFHAATPIYYMKFAVSANGRTIHINSESQKVMGFYCGLAAERVTEGLADIGLYVQSVTKVDSTHIQLTLHTPCPPIVVDTQQVYEVDGYGFSVITPNNTNILQSVEVKPNHWSEQVINITTSEDCTNAKVRYGCNGVISGDSDGYARGSRGNIRDSQGLQYFATVNGKQIPMHNWLYFGEWLITT